MTASFEISDRFIEAGDASELLYAPLSQPLTYRKTRRYDFEFEGDEAKLNQFVTNTLVDKVSQTMHEVDGKGEAIVDGEPLFSLDYGMKPGALDLEKEAIVSYYKSLRNPGFELKDLKIRQCIYVFSAKPSESCDPEIFVRDICNGAIHNWNVSAA